MFIVDFTDKLARERSTPKHAPCRTHDKIIGDTINFVGCGFASFIRRYNRAQFFNQLVTQRAIELERFWILVQQQVPSIKQYV